MSWNKSSDYNNMQGATIKNSKLMLINNNNNNKTYNLGGMLPSI